MKSRVLTAVAVCIGLLGCPLLSSAINATSPLAMNVSSDTNQNNKTKKNDKKKPTHPYMMATDPQYKDCVFMLEDGTRLTPKQVEALDVTNFAVSFMKEVAAEYRMTKDEIKAGKKRVVMFSEIKK